MYLSRYKTLFLHRLEEFSSRDKSTFTHIDLCTIYTTMLIWNKAYNYKISEKMYLFLVNLKITILTKP